MEVYKLVKKEFKDIVKNSKKNFISFVFLKEKDQNIIKLTDDDSYINQIKYVKMGEETYHFVDHLYKNDLKKIKMKDLENYLTKIYKDKINAKIKIV